MNETQTQWNLLAALRNETFDLNETTGSDSSVFEISAQFIASIGNGRMFPGWSYGLETAFMQWAATALNNLIVQNTPKP